MRDMAVMTRATTIIDNRNTRFQYPNIPELFDEKTIYRAFIHYCRMNQQYTAAAAAAAGGNMEGEARSANPVATAVTMYLHTHYYTLKGAFSPPLRSFAWRRHQMTPNHLEHSTRELFPII
jgi:hypothetical protein